jgi:tRNA-splicing ligase RtcB
MSETTYNVIAPESGVPVKAWTKGVPLEDAARKQLLNAAQLPFIFKWIAAMPDVHWGIGATVGSVIPTKGAIIPAAVGVDIGCGMMAVQTSLNARDLPDNLKGIRTAIETAVPHGRTNHGGVGDRGAWHDIPERNGSVWLGELKVRYDAILAKHPKLDRGNHANHLGTLGTGNHFIEVCLDESETVWFMLHSGSRGVGNRMGSLGFEDGRNHKRSKTLASVAARAVGFGFGVALIGCAPRPGHVSRGLHAHFSINCCRSQPGSALPLRQAQARAMDPE